MAYDSNNIFAKILRQEIPCDLVYEDTHVIAFQDINPKAPTHILVVPRGDYTCFDDFSANATPKEIADFFQAVGRIARDLDLDQSGYRIIMNKGSHGGQEVDHFHAHILGGKPLGPMISINE